MSLSFKNIHYIIKRFKSMMIAYVGENLPMYKIAYYIIDYVFNLIIFGASISDYFAYGFYKMRYNGKNEYITYRRFHKLQKKLNPRIECREICRNKVLFNNRFKDYIGREWLDISSSTLDEFTSFLQKHKVFFVKEVLGYRGIGTTKYNVETIANIELLYNSLHTNSFDVRYIVEEQITQLKVLSELHPWSINTIRIVTVYNTKTNKVHFINARLRMGNKRNSVDNFHYDGIGANIDISSGVINSVGYDTNNRTYIYHPETGKQIIGLKIPFWEECKEYINKVAKLLPEVRYIGWDIVIKEDGGFILLEGNDNADHDFQQLYNKGLWKEYKYIIKQIK